jgi:hypothetical protein
MRMPPTDRDLFRFALALAAIALAGVIGYLLRS